MNEQPEKRSMGFGCIALLIGGGCIVVLVVCGGFVVGIVAVVFGMIKSSEPYTNAVAKAQASPAVTEAIGEPVEPGFFVSGNININGSSGNANLSIPISGPKGEGVIYVVAEKSGGQWTFTALEVTISNRVEKVDLLEEESVGDSDAKDTTQVD